jgi:hypothetical protein
MSEQPTTDQLDADQLETDSTTAAPEFKPFTSRLVLWQIAKELQRVASELTLINQTLKKISQKIK